jgi:pimeloyl-ACP methyl ester carboxylesterase
MTNFVLVHGSWAGGTVWHKLEPLLTPHAHVFTPTLSGFDVDEIATPEMGLHLHINEIADLLEHENLENVVLVGHSYGGMVIQGVAERSAERISRLVFLDAFIPEHDQCLFDLLPEKSAQGMRSRLTDDTGRTLEQGASRAWLIPAPPSLDGWKLFGEDAAWLKTQLTPTAVATFEERVKLENPAARGLPRSFVRCSEFPTFQGMETKALEADWSIRHLECGHFAQLEQPEKLAAILLKDQVELRV